MNKKTSGGILNAILGDESTKLTPKPLGFLHSIYLCGEIKSPENYINEFDTIRNANESDVIKIHINSVGGDMSTAIQFIRAMSESSGNIIASVEGYCMSAATMIFLTAEAFEISEHTMFMFHNYSGGSFGKGGEMYDHIVNERKWSEKIIHKVYDGFLSEEEIKAILDNKDIWMDGEEVNSRLQKKIKAQIEMIEAKKLTNAAAKSAPKEKPAAKKTRKTPAPKK